MRATLLVMCVVSACGRIGFDAQRDAGSDAQAPHNLAFFTSTLLTPAAVQAMSANGDMLAGGDALCMQRAAAGGLPGTYVSLLSDATTNAVDRLSVARGWVRLDGLPIADLPADLFTKLLYPILYNETGAAQTTEQVMTGTSGSGEDGPDCQHWTSNSATQIVSTGNTTDGAFGFVARYIPPCNAEEHVYCFGVDDQTPVTFTPQTGRIAFLSTPWTPGSGLASADAQCQANASTNALPGTYLALLATTTATAASRMTATGATWVRPDGIPVAQTPDELFAGELLTAIDVRADGTTQQGGTVWGGALGTLVASSNESCTDWVSNSAAITADVGVVSDGPGGLFGEGYTAACNSALPLYCLQQ